MAGRLARARLAGVGLQRQSCPAAPSWHSGWQSGGRVHRTAVQAGKATRDFHNVVEWPTRWAGTHDGERPGRHPRGHRPGQDRQRNRAQGLRDHHTGHSQGQRAREEGPRDRPCRDLYGAPGPVSVPPRRRFTRPPHRDGRSRSGSAPVLWSDHGRVDAVRAGRSVGPGWSRTPRRTAPRWRSRPR